jgi:hypothetical protein
LLSSGELFVAQLAQAYLHLKPYTASIRKLKALGKAADTLASDAAKRIYDGGVIIDVELEDGSLIVRVTVIGLLTGHLALEVYGKVADYKGFKESVVELCGDAQEFAVDVCEPFRKKAGATEEQVYRFERRLMTPGKLNRLAKRLQRLENSVAALSPRDMQKELSEANREFSKIIKDLTPAEVQVVETGITLKDIPPPSKWPLPAPELPKLVLKEEEQLVFDQEIGLMVPVPTPITGNRRLVYRNRTRVEEQLPTLDRQKRPANALRLHIRDSDH